MPQIVNKKSVLEMAMGAIAEITDYEVERVVANIMDPNTNATAKRKITITLTFAPDDYRQQIGMDAQAKTTLAPIQPVRTSLCITKARDGSLLLAEMTPQVPGQVDMPWTATASAASCAARWRCRMPSAAPRPTARPGTLTRCWIPRWPGWMSRTTA